MNKLFLTLVAGLFALSAGLADAAAADTQKNPEKIVKEILKRLEETEVPPTPKAGPENTLYLDLKDGRAVIEMRPDLAPKHVARIKELVRRGFYDGLKFHRVIGGFMAQTGDPKGDGTGGSGQNIPAEFSDEKFRRGTVGMARSDSPDSADSQFFICYARTAHLDGKYTVWGRVTKGMAFVGNIKRGNSSDNGAVVNPDKIVRLRVAADVKE